MGFLLVVVSHKVTYGMVSHDVKDQLAFLVSTILPSLHIRESYRSARITIYVDTQLEFPIP